MINRRRFLGSSIAAAGLTALSPSLGEGQAAVPPGTIAVSDQSWRLWLDTAAEWKDDVIYLPEDVILPDLPAHPPTGGWDALNSSAGISVELPATVEQFYWGLSGFRPYQGEYRFEADDHAFQNGAYYGVSWWFRDIEIPASFRDKRIFLHVRAARQRAEIFLNRQLVGYSILEELPFECDLTRAARPGQANSLAIRITNPGGRFDWV